VQVRDNEVSAERWVSPEERERLHKAAEEAAAREAAAQGDNLGRRGLMNMMNGTLETRREEDEIFIELVRPAWMDEKEAEYLSEDEKAQIKEFEDKVKKLAAEREKRAKGLLTELAKLRVEIQDICKTFNERVVGLKDTKMVFDGALYECELLVIRLAQARLHRDPHSHTADPHSRAAQPSRTADPHSCLPNMAGAAAPRGLRAQVARAREGARAAALLGG